MTFDGTPEDLWIPASYLNGWVDYGAPYDGVHFRRYRVGGGFKVELDGVCKSGVLNSVMFNLPVGFRPPNDVIRVGSADNTARRIDVGANGNVFTFSATSNAYTALAGISFWL